MRFLLLVHVQVVEQVLQVLFPVKLDLQGALLLGAGHLHLPVQVFPHRQLGLFKILVLPGFLPQGVSVSAGASGLTVDNSGSVSIWGNNEVIIKAEGAVSFKAQSITVKGAEEVKAVNEAGTGAELTGELTLTGAEVLIN